MQFHLAQIFLSVCLLLCWKGQAQTDSLVYESQNLKIRQISDHAYIHITYLDTEQYGKVACNGMLVINNKEAVVLETPVNDSDSEELIKWIEDNHQASIKAVLVHHFHVDCLGGLKAFHLRNIPSYANQQTIDLVREGNEIPLYAIEDGHKTGVGDQSISSHYFGPAHTEDNIISYYGSEMILFGGCMIKAMGGAKGNLADANVEEWSKSVEKIKTAIPDIDVVIPGHGREGGKELLDYTIQMFNEK